ncbi:hypothetical protein RBU49_10570 [Clostridium sp. MB40-C1]|uniref:hypothetical protein n=1 Tax=Clostridium sp. MB40-C1 TaxID=3070996 RepID=UPI0027DFAC4C|nr:hypothetical protein [Clostridium sp. MB40-C1]WMJ79333.1 hypothetical protein RBU49_10570 [Clostridium sp. MB40-C1]
MKMLKNLLDKLAKVIDENELGTDNYLEEVEFKLNNDKEYNLKACETLMNMNNMFSA